MYFPSSVLSYTAEAEKIRIIFLRIPCSQSDVCGWDLEGRSETKAIMLLLGLFLQASKPIEIWSISTAVIQWCLKLCKYWEVVALECSSGSVLLIDSRSLDHSWQPLVLKPHHQWKPLGAPPSLTMAEVAPSLTEHFYHVLELIARAILVLLGGLFCFLHWTLSHTSRLYLRGMMKSNRAQWCGKNVTMYEIIHLLNEHVTDTKWALLLDTRNISLPWRSLHNLMIHDLMIEIY